MTTTANPETLESTATKIEPQKQALTDIQAVCNDVLNNALVSQAGDAKAIIDHTSEMISRIQAVLRAAAAEVTLADSNTNMSTGAESAAYTAAVTDLSDAVNLLNRGAEYSPLKKYQGDELEVAYDELNPDLRPGQTYKLINEPLWVDANGNPVDPDPDDIRQGGLGDCWLLAGLGSVVQADPEAIKRLIDDNGDGTYTVHFRDRDVTVDGWVSTDNSQNAFWVKIVEKAYAQYAGGEYEDLVNDSSGRGLKDLFDLDTKTHDPDSSPDLGVFNDNKDPAKSIKEIETAMANDQPVTVSVKGELGIDGGHALWVTEVVERDGQKIVILQNPWQSTNADVKAAAAAAGGQAFDDGRIEIPADAFGDLVRKVYIAEPVTP